MLMQKLTEFFGVYGSYIVIVIVAAVIILILREVTCWYFKINEQIKLRKIEIELMYDIKNNTAPFARMDESNPSIIDKDLKL